MNFATSGAKNATEFNRTFGTTWTNRMSTERQLSHFSLISRLFGNLFYRAPTDLAVKQRFTWLQQKGLSQVWALDTDVQSEQALDVLCK